MPRRPDMPPLDRGDLDLDPIVQFGAWFDYARREVELPEAMTLATVDAGGAPDARMVLLKGVDERGFRLFTNRDSRQGDAARRLAACGAGGLLARARPSGAGARADRAARRRGVRRLLRLPAPRLAAGRLGLAAVTPDRLRTELDQHLDEVEARFADREVPRPPHWGGYLVEPEEVEFWQGRIGRLHDRFRYTRERSEWRIERLAP